MAYDEGRVESLVARTKEGDRMAFGALYDLFSKDIYRFTLVLVRSVPEAQDITSETFVRVWRSITRYEKGNFRAYVFMIARNLAYDALRRRKRAPDTIEDEESIEDNKLSPLLDAVKTEEEKAVYAAVMGLPPEYREVVTLRFFNNLPTKDVAEMLGKTEASVKITQHRAMEKLREKLKQHER